jgi:hypothetical protein
MRPLAIAAFLLALLATPVVALAQTGVYRLIGGGSTSLIFIEESTVRARGELTFVWQTIVFKQAYEDDGNKYSKVRVQINCAKETYANLEWVRYSATGQSVGSGTMPFVEKALIPGSVMETFVQFVCAGASASADRDNYPDVSEPVAYTDRYFATQ